MAHKRKQETYTHTDKVEEKNAIHYCEETYQAYRFTLFTAVFKMSVESAEKALNGT